MTEFALKQIFFKKCNRLCVLNIVDATRTSLTDLKGESFGQRTNYHVKYDLNCTKIVARTAQRPLMLLQESFETTFTVWESRIQELLVCIHPLSVGFRDWYSRVKKMWHSSLQSTFTYATDVWALQPVWCPTSGPSSPRNHHTKHFYILFLLLPINILIKDRTVLV